MRAYESHNKTLCAATFMVIDIDICFSKGRKKEKGRTLWKISEILFSNYVGKRIFHLMIERIKKSRGDEPSLKKNIKKKIY